MKTLLTTLLLIATIAVNAQNTYVYEYDNNGNRELRQVLTSTMAAPATKAAVTQTTINFNEENIKVYPNPTRGYLRVDIPAIEEFTNQTVFLTVFDNAGKVILQQQAQLQNNISLKQQESGIYFIEIRAGDQKETWQIVKEN